MGTTRQSSLSPQFRPREKYAEDPSGKALSPVELLAIILGTGSVGCPVHELALRMIDAFPTLAAFVKADWLEMKARIAEYNGRNPSRSIKGLADAKLMKVAAAFQLTRRVNPLEDYAFRNYNLRISSSAYEVFRRIVESAPEKEHFFVLPMDSDFHALCEPLDISQGSVSRTPVQPRDVFCEAVRYRAFAIIVAHNHPSGDPEPSKEDIEITERLIETGKLLGIRVLDHLVLGSPASAKGQGFVSIRNLAIINF